MRPPLRLEAKQKSGAIRSIIFRQSPKSDYRELWSVNTTPVAEIGERWKMSFSRTGGILALEGIEPSLSTGHAERLGLAVASIDPASRYGVFGR
jgi:hypothetical protein